MSNAQSDSVSIRQSSTVISLLHHYSFIDYLCLPVECVNHIDQLSWVFDLDKKFVLWTVNNRHLSSVTTELVDQFGYIITDDILPNQLSSRMSLLAHRGVCKDRKGKPLIENTVDSLTEAVNLGYAGIEYDVMVFPFGIYVLHGIKQLRYHCLSKDLELFDKVMRPCLENKYASVSLVTFYLWMFLKQINGVKDSDNDHLDPSNVDENRHVENFIDLEKMGLFFNAYFNSVLTLEQLLSRNDSAIPSLSKSNEKLLPSRSFFHNLEIKWFYNQPKSDFNRLLNLLNQFKIQKESMLISSFSLQLLDIIQNIEQFDYTYGLLLDS